MQERCFSSLLLVAAELRTCDAYCEVLDGTTLETISSCQHDDPKVRCTHWLLIWRDAATCL